MDRIRVGRAIRAVRRRRALRQVDVALRAHVRQQAVSQVERGDFGHMMLDTVDAVARAVGVELALVARYRGSDLARLLDEGHAQVVGAVAARLRALGWEVLLEYSFSEFGERGSVDVLAWHPEHRALLIVEVKTAIVDLQDLLVTQDRKARLVPRLVARERGWQPAVVGRVLALPDDTTLRRQIGRHAAVFDAALPARTREVAAWLRRPAGALRGIWFLAFTAPGGGKQGPGASSRIRAGK